VYVVMYFNNMSFIECLNRHQRTGRGVKLLLNRFGATNWRMFSTSFVELSEDEVMALLFNWMIRRHKRSTKIRLREFESQDVYELWFNYTIGNIFITKATKCTALYGKLLYDWRPTTNANGLRADTIERAVQRADEINAQRIMSAQKL